MAWLETPYPSLPEGQSGEDHTEVAGLAGCADDPCQTGWPPNDIRAVANDDFLAANPTVETLLELVSIPLDDILDQNARMVEGDGDTADIRRHAEEWITANQGTVLDWIVEADPDAVPVRTVGSGLEPSTGDQAAARAVANQPSTSARFASIHAAASLRTSASVYSSAMAMRAF